MRIYSTCCSRHVLSPLKYICVSLSIPMPCSVRWQRIQLAHRRNSAPQIKPPEQRSCRLFVPRGCPRRGRGSQDWGGEWGRNGAGTPGAPGAVPPVRQQKGLLLEHASESNTFPLLQSSPAVIVFLFF